MIWGANATPSLVEFALARRAAVNSAKVLASSTPHPQTPAPSLDIWAGARDTGHEHGARGRRGWPRLAGVALSREMGRIASRGLPGFVTTYAYDALGRLAKQGSPLGDFTYTYDGATGRPLTLAYPNGQSTAYLYFPTAQDHRLQEIKHLSPSASILSKFNYTYDAVGNIKTWRQQTGSSPAQLYELGYDLADQLTAATLKSTDPTPAVVKSYAYAYDPAGNRTVESIDSMVVGASHNSRNQLISRQAGGALRFAGTLSEPAIVTVEGQPATVDASNRFEGTAPVTTGTNTVTVTAQDYAQPPNVRTQDYEVSVTGFSGSFTYDANGNLTSDGTKTYEWDAENRLLAVKEGGSTLASFTYDGQGRRATKTAGGVTTGYVYDGAQFLEERPGAGTPKRYVYDLDIDRPLAQAVGSANSYFVADHLGSIAQVTDSAGTPTLTREFDPWGNPLQGSTIGGYAFTGREWDPETSLYYYRARYYDASTARFLGEDPEGLTAGFNLYSYVHGRPTIATDSSGRRAELRCRTIKRSGRDIPGVHCYLFVKCQEPDDGTDSGGCLIGYLFPTYIFEDYQKTAPPTHGDVASALAGTFSKHNVYGPSAVEKCLVEKGRQWANQYIINYRGVRGPNSNTYVHWLLSACGADSAAPGPAFGWEKVPGWSPGLTPDKSKRGGASDF